jgi:hypothetical protein
MLSTFCSNGSIGLSMYANRKFILNTYSGSTTNNYIYCLNSFTNEITEALMGTCCVIDDTGLIFSCMIKPTNVNIPCAIYTSSDNVQLFLTDLPNNFSSPFSLAMSNINNILIAGCKGSQPLQKSTDLKTFSSIADSATSSVNDVSISSTGKYILICGFGGASKDTNTPMLSTDSGGTFTHIPIPISTSTAITFCAVSSTGENMFIGSGSTNNFISRNYGADWTAYNVSSSIYGGLCISDDLTYFGCLTGTGYKYGGPIITTSTTLSLSSASSGTTSPSINAGRKIACSLNGKVVVFVGLNNNVYYSVDKGINFSNVQTVYADYALIKFLAANVSRNGKHILMLATTGLYRLTFFAN